MTKNNTTAKITNAVMMGAYVEFAKLNLEGFTAYCDEHHVNAEDVLTKADKHLETLTKPRTKSTTPTKTQLANAALLRTILPQMVEPMRANDIATKFGLSSAQKATGLMRYAIAQGLVEKTIINGVAMFKAL